MQLTPMILALCTTTNALVSNPAASRLHRKLQRQSAGLTPCTTYHNYQDLMYRFVRFANLDMPSQAQQSDSNYCYQLLKPMLSCYDREACPSIEGKLNNLKISITFRRPVERKFRDTLSEATSNSCRAAGQKSYCQPFN